MLTTSIFFRTNSTYGVVLNVAFKLKKKKNFAFFLSEGDFSKTLQTAQNLLSQKKNLGIKDLVLIKSHDGTSDVANNFQLMVKVTHEKVISLTTIRNPNLENMLKISKKLKESTKRIKYLRITLSESSK